MVDDEHPLTLQEVLDAVTDEQAQAEGYPNADVFRLSFQLGNLAGEWRETKEDRVVQEYHQLFQHLIDLGWDYHLIAWDEMLPDEFMPEIPEISKKTPLSHKD